MERHTLRIYSRIVLCGFVLLIILDISSDVSFSTFMGIRIASG
jgi:hypothetical protein